MVYTDLLNADLRGADFRFADLVAVDMTGSVYDDTTDYLDADSLPLSAMVRQPASTGR